MVSLAIVAVLPGDDGALRHGLIAKDWAKEIGVNYAPPRFLGPEPAAVPARTRARGARRRRPASQERFNSSVVDPMAKEIAANQGGKDAPLPVADGKQGRRSPRRRHGGDREAQRRRRRRGTSRRSAGRRHGGHRERARAHDGAATGARGDAAVRRRQVGPRRARQDHQGIARRRSSSASPRPPWPPSSAPCWARSPATTAAGSTTCSTGSTACSAPSPISC